MQFRSFPAILDSLAPIREYLTTVAQSAGLGKKKTYYLCLAVDEIAANIILYGYEKAGLKGNIDIKITITENQFVTILEDDAPPYNPLQQKMPTDNDLSRPLEDRPIGGLGIFLAVKSVDKFDYEYMNGRNRNIFVLNR